MKIETSATLREQSQLTETTVHLSYRWTIALKEFSSKTKVDQKWFQSTGIDCSRKESIVLREPRWVKRGIS
jgi:hypothetical protein